MGREIRRVPANWQHPQKEEFSHRKSVMELRYQPLHDEPFSTAMREWIAGWEAWERGEYPEYCDDEQTRASPYWEYAGAPPNPTYYRPDWKPEEMTWWQIYETVSEGTPVTPPFATREELVDYLVANGDFWDQLHRKEGPSWSFHMPCDPWPREQAERFVMGAGHAPSLVVIDGKVMTGVEFVTQV